jgi:stalled ribosome alternative rescue factor ArfA
MKNRKNPIARALRLSPHLKPQTVRPKKGRGSYQRTK